MNKASYTKRKSSLIRDNRIFIVKLRRFWEKNNIQLVQVGANGVAMPDFANPMYGKWLEN